MRHLTILESMKHFQDIMCQMERPIIFILLLFRSLHNDDRYGHGIYGDGKKIQLQDKIVQSF